MIIDNAPQPKQPCFFFDKSPGVHRTRKRRWKQVDLWRTAYPVAMCGLLLRSNNDMKCPGCPGPGVKLKGWGKNGEKILAGDRNQM